MPVQTTRLTPELEKSITGVLRTGASLKAAADMHSIPYPTVHAWLMRGLGTHPKPRKQPYIRFAAAVAKAKADAEVALLLRVQAAGRGGTAYVETHREYRMVTQMVNGVATRQRQLIREREINRPVQGDWRADQWLLQVINPETFARRQQIELAGAIGAYVVEAPPKAEDLAAWRLTYSPHAPINTPGNGHALDDEGSASGNGANGHGGNGAQ
jgi:hypothetical protein